MPTYECPDIKYVKVPEQTDLDYGSIEAFKASLEDCLQGKEKTTAELQNILCSASGVKHVELATRNRLLETYKGRSIGASSNHPSRNQHTAMCFGPTAPSHPFWTGVPRISDDEEKKDLQDPVSGERRTSPLPAHDDSEPARKPEVTVGQKIGYVRAFLV